MTIKEIRVSREVLDLTRPYTIAYKTVSEMETVLVEVVSVNGLKGLGTANPSYQVVGESVADSMEILTEENLQPFIGRDIRQLNQLCHELQQAFPEHPGARAALDIAFHDLFGHVIELPLVEYLGQHHYEMPTSITIGIKNVAETLEEAREYIDRKFRILKVKLGHSLEEDIERLIKLRETYGNEIGIRVDANQGYTVEEFLTFMEQTDPLNIELIEQPLKSSLIQTMRELPPDIKPDIAADESLISPQDAWDLATPSPACGIFNIKLMKCGGIHQARRIAAISRFSDQKLMWGCNDESIIGITAALHAAFSCPNTRFIDLDGSLDLGRDLVMGGFEIVDGMMRLSGGSGLGVFR